MRLLKLVVASVLAVPALAADMVPDEGPKHAVEWAPNAEFYPQYIADPLRPQSALKILGVADSEIPVIGVPASACRMA